MKTSIRSAFIAAATIAAFTNPIAAMARPLNMTDFVARYPAAQEKSVTNPAQDYIDSFNRQDFTVRMQSAATSPASEAAKDYVDGFSGHGPHIETSTNERAKIGDGFTRPSTLIR